MLILTIQVLTRRLVAPLMMVNLQLTPTITPKQTSGTIQAAILPPSMQARTPALLSTFTTKVLGLLSMLIRVPSSSLMQTIRIRKSLFSTIALKTKWTSWYLSKGRPRSSRKLMRKLSLLVAAREKRTLWGERAWRLMGRCSEAKEE